MLNSPTIHLHVVSGNLEGIGPPPGPSHQSAYAMSLFLDPCSETPWTPETRREAHNGSRLNDISIISSNLLSIIGSPIQEPPCTTDIPTCADTSDHPSEPYTRGPIWASKIENDGPTCFLGPRSKVPWTPEDLGRRERVAENLWMENGLLCMRGDNDM